MPAMRVVSEQRLVEWTVTLKLMPQGSTAVFPFPLA